MTAHVDYDLSVIVPLYNEIDGLRAFHASLVSVVAKLDARSYEVIYCDDGSTDSTDELIRKWNKTDQRVKLIKLSRNFGKENALSAGIAAAHGDVLVMIDGDGQHPVELIPNFIEVWRRGAQVVVGVSKNNKNDGWKKRGGSALFYALFNKMTGQKLLAGATDFRLITRAVQKEFLKLNESDRITRGLIDWLGFKRQYLYFNTKARQSGTAGYSLTKLVRLAVDSFVSLTPMPLYLFGYLGVLITLGSFLLGLVVFCEQIIFSDPWAWRFTGTAMLGIMIMFLVGIVLMSQGILSLYISHIHTQSKQRPLYIIDQEGSAGITTKPS